MSRAGDWPTLGRILTEEVRRELEERGVVGPEENIAAAVVRALEQGRGSSPTGPTLPVDALEAEVARRIEAALAAGIDAGLVDAGTTAQTLPYRPPTVVWGADAHEVDTTARARTLAAQPGRKERVLVLTGSAGPEELERIASTLPFPSGTEVRTLADDSALAELEHMLGELAQGDPGAPGAPGRAARSPRDARDMVGEVFAGKYELLELIGQGGFGAVFKARDAKLETEVAIKILRPRALRDQRAVRDFMQEARRMTRLTHPNIVQWKVLDETEDGITYFVMEFLEGEELMETIRREGKLEVDRAQRLLLQVLDALRSAHHLPDGASILHLDLKPQNIFLARGPRGEEIAKVIDFGIGQLAGGDDGGGSGGSAEGPGTLQVATAGSNAYAVHEGLRFRRCTACTPEYASPEQCGHMLPEVQPIPLDGRSDLYSLGVIAFQMLTGELPFERPAVRGDLLRMHREVPPTKLRELRRVPRGLQRFVERSLEKDRDQRWRDTNEAYEALERIVQPPIWPLVAKVALVLALLLGPAAWWLFPEASLPALGVDVSHLVLGPERVELPVSVTGLELPRPVTWALVADPAEPDAPLPGLRVEERDGRLVVAADADRGRLENRGHLVATDASGRRQQTPGIDVTFIAQGDWELRDPGEYGLVPGLDGRALDPVGQRLEIQVRAVDREDLARVELWVGEERRPATYEGQVPTEGRPLHRYSVADSDLLPEGRVEYGVRVTDRAGRTQEHSSAIEVVRARPEPACEVRARPSSKPGYPNLVTPGLPDPAVLVALPHGARLTWQLLPAPGSEAPVDLGTSSAFAADGSWEIPLSGFAALGPGEWYGELRIEADDTERVLRADPDRGKGRARIPLHYSGRAIDIAIDVPGREVRPIGETRAVLLNQREVGVRLTRISDLDAFVHVAQDPGVEADPPRTRLTAHEASRTFQLKLPDSDGCHRVTFEARREAALDDDTESEERGAPEWAEALVFVLDRSPAVPRLAGAARWLEPVADARPLEISFEDEVLLEGHERRVSASWTLSEAGAGGAAVGLALDAGSLGRLATAATTPLPLDLGRDPASSVPDGRYVVEVTCRDDFGNAPERARWAFELALRPPEVALREPLLDGAWERSVSGKFRFEVTARDPNGLEDARYILRDTEGSIEPRTGDLERLPEDFRDRSAFAAEVELERAWARRQVALEVEVRPRLGTEPGRGSWSFELGDIERELPTRVEIEPGLDTCAMRLVPGNDDFEYVFHGRSTEQENKELWDLGLPREVRRAWEVGYAPRTIGDFYLDEAEVSIAQFRRFFESESFLDQELWPGGARPERSPELRATLGAADAEAPVTGVTWEEAFAYARWAGKRLPSCVEFEYALREGEAYLLFPGVHGRSGSPGKPSGERYAYNPEVSFEDPPIRAVRAETDDVTSGGVANLGGNVKEWTGTPRDFASSPAFRERRAEALAPHRFELEREDGYWVAGASHRSASVLFNRKEFQGRGERLGDVGFRCALDAAVVEATLEGRSDGPRVRPVAR